MLINDIFQFSNFLLLIKLINYKTIINYSRTNLHRENGSSFGKGKIRGLHRGGKGVIGAEPSLVDKLYRS